MCPEPEAACTGLRSRGAQAEQLKQRPHEVLRRNGNPLVNNFAAVIQAWIQILFCVSLNFAGGTASKS